MQSLLWKFSILDSLNFDWSLHQNKKSAVLLKQRKSVVASHKTGHMKLESAIDSGAKPHLIVPVISWRLPTSDLRARLPRPQHPVLSFSLWKKYYRQNLIFISQLYSVYPRMLLLNSDSHLHDFKRNIYLFCMFLDLYHCIVVGRSNIF